MSPRNQFVSLVESQRHVINSANPGGALDDGVEDRLHVRRRAANDAEHLGRRSLMLQSLAQFCVALLDLLKQAHICSMAITAWSAKVLRRAICLSVKGSTVVRRMRIAPIATPSRTSGTASWVRSPNRSTPAWRISGNSVAAMASKSSIWIG